MDIKEKMFEAIANFVETHIYEQSFIYLSRTDYGILHNEAEASMLSSGPNFLIGSYGSDMRFCDLEVRIHPDDCEDIVIC